MTDELYTQAADLGWPLVPTYGMTETSSQIATATPGDPRLKILPHIEFKVSENGTLSIKSEALLSAYALNFNNRFWVEDPKRDGWFETSDRVNIIDNTYLEVIGRTDDMIKIGGEAVIFSALEKKLENLVHKHTKSQGFALRLVEDERLGNKLELLVEENVEDEKVQLIRMAFDASVLLYERIREVVRVNSIPRSPLGKILHTKETAN